MTAWQRRVSSVDVVIHVSPAHRDAPAYLEGPSLLLGDCDRPAFVTCSLLTVASRSDWMRLGRVRESTQTANSSSVDLLAGPDN